LAWGIEWTLQVRGNLDRAASPHVPAGELGTAVNPVVCRLPLTTLPGYAANATVTNVTN
jgi:hypothetical protein